MIDQLRQMLGSEWKVTEEQKEGGYIQLVCRHKKGVYFSPWFRELSLGNVVFMARMCHQTIQEDEVSVG